MYCYNERHYDKCHYAECRYAECRGAMKCTQLVYFINILCALLTAVAK
jgi:hypothetical protein